MKKNVLNLWLLAALLCGLSLSVTSCKDDDDDNGPSAEEQAEQQAREQAEAFWGVVSHLTGADVITDDYQNKDFEPIIGEPSDDNPLHRIVGTNDMMTAAERFNNLVGEDVVDENTADYTWTNDAVGTLTYHKSQDGKSWSTVDVSIKQVPSLERIIYASPQQTGDNSEFDGTAYYRFGDIVSRSETKKGVTHYEEWICVRPCFGPEGKEKSHWISISPLPEANVWTYTGSNKIDYALPTGLDDNVEHAQNFAELLYAICFPKKWQQNVINNQDNKKMRMFHDFDKSRLKYHSHYFWQRVHYGWVKEHKVFEDLFGIDVAKMQEILESEDGLNLLTKGYSWWTTGPFATNSPKLYRERFTNGQGIKSNMHEGGKIETVTKEVIKSMIQLNVNEQYTIDQPYWVDSAFFGTKTPHYIIRHATGAQLSSTGKEDPKQPLAGVRPYWVYNLHYGIRDLTTPPETFDGEGNPTNDTGYKNRAYFTQGDIVKDANGNRWMCVQPSGYGDANRFKEQPYSYFVSFEKKPVAGNLLVPNVPATKNLAAQMLFCLEVLYHDYAMNYHNNTTYSYQIAQNMRDNLDVELAELLAERDTMYTFKGKTQAESVPCSFGSTLYRDDSNNLYVLRLVGDYTKEQDGGGRDMSWYFYTNYTGSTTPMLLTQIADSTYIKKYREDQWVYQPWIDIATGQTSTKYTGPRSTKKGTIPSEKSFNIENLIYKKGYSVLNGMVTTNMYREPIIAFAVKRVRDNGVKVNRFDDDVEFTEYKMMREIDEEDFGLDEPQMNDRILNTYQQYSGHRIFLEEKNWPFGMANSIKGY